MLTTNKATLADRMKDAAVSPDFAWIANSGSGWQFGEQGMLKAITDRLKLGHGSVVEIGAGDGDKLPLSCQLLIDDGWWAWLYESDESKCAALARKFAETKKNVAIVNKAIQSVNETISRSVLIVDVDGKEYSILEGMTQRPVVIMVEHHDLDDPNGPESFYVPGDDAGVHDAAGYCKQATWRAFDKLLTDYVPVARTRINSIYCHKDYADTLREASDKEFTFQSGSVSAIRLNIGAGDVPCPGYTPIDRKLGSEAYPLHYPDNSVDEIRASHVLEHFTPSESREALKEWFRVLKPGGIIRIAVPDLEKAAHMMLAGEDHGYYASWIYGGQTDANDFHKSGYNSAGLAMTLRGAGFISVEPWVSTIKDCAALPVSLNLQAIKPTKVSRSMCAIMSTPRLIHKHNYLGVMDVMVKRHIPLFDFGGAYWHHGIERLMRAHWDDYEWMLCIDYDTLFNVEIFDRMVTTFELNPGYDALAPLQVRREGTGVLANFNANGDDMLRDVVPADTAHFGFTLFRTEALRKFGDWCKNEGQPMLFEGISPNATWDDSAIDADMMFWYRFKQAGFKLGLTPRIGVGHLENLGVWVGEDMQPVFQPISQFQRIGAPHNARR